MNNIDDHHMDAIRYTMGLRRKPKLKKVNLMNKLKKLIFKIKTSIPYIIATIFSLIIAGLIIKLAGYFFIILPMHIFFYLFN